MARPAKPVAAQKAQAEKAAAVKAGAAPIAPPVLEPGEWQNIMTCLDQVVRSSGQLGGLQGAAALLGTAGKIQAYLAALSPPQPQG